MPVFYNIRKSGHIIMRVLIEIKLRNHFNLYCDDRKPLLYNGCSHWNTASGTGIAHTPPDLELSPRFNLLKSRKMVVATFSVYFSEKTV